MNTFIGNLQIQKEKNHFFFLKVKKLKYLLSVGKVVMVMRLICIHVVV